MKTHIICNTNAIEISQQAFEQFLKKEMEKKEKMFRHKKVK